jgi:hypothetical protein
MVTIRTLPASPERWDDIVTAFGRPGEDPGWAGANGSWSRQSMAPR